MVFQKLLRDQQFMILYGGLDFGRFKQGLNVSFSKTIYIAFYGCYKSYVPKMSQFVSCMLQLLHNLRRVFIFPNNIREINHFTLHLLKRSDN